MTVTSAFRTAPDRPPTSLGRRAAASAAAVAAGALLLAACGGGGGDTGGRKDTGSAAPLATALPQSIRDKGYLDVGSDIAYPPVEFKDAKGRAVGLDPDLAAALGRQLGVEFRFRIGTFDTLLTGLRAKRYDIAMSAFTDNKNRQNGIDPATGKKVGEGVDFVDYFSAGVAMYVRKDAPSPVKGWGDLCGRKAVLQRGSVSEDLARKLSARCVAAGKAPIALEPFDNDQQAQTRLRSGGGDVGISDYPVAEYAARTSGGGRDFRRVGGQVQAAPYGIAVAKGNTQLRDALKSAVDAVMASGEYTRILKKWGVTGGAIHRAEINGGS
ncbi:atrA protein [Streptomyces sp. Ru73]|uniref:ABC transporter substrate-binding protein n=1 Tax=Streptomyces sp. Ru73 TaxID=2080748 RepID=UPI000CDD6E8E|nr:ABC transporter substrate-binding protein [Streptomyces sp. Ru73]POX41409.1 atrA protein [Streptomyces sp. Ru73]